MKKWFLKPVTYILNHLKLKSIQFIISVSFLSVTFLAMVFVSTTLSNKFSNMAEQSAVINTRQIVNQVNTNLDYYLKNMMQISDSLKDILSSSENIPSENLLQQMNMVLGTRKDIVSLAVFSSEGKLLAGVPINNTKSDINVKNEEWFYTPLKEPANLYFSSPHVQNLFEGQHSWVVTLSRAVTLKINGRDTQGLLLVDMNFSAIDQLLQNVKLGTKGYIYIIDSNGNIVYHPQQQLINAGLKHENLDDVSKHVFGRYFDNYNGQRRLITIDTVNYCRWRIIGIAYMDEMSVIRRDIVNYVLFILLIGVIVTTSISSALSAKISQPIKQLEKSMKLVEQGNFDINIDVKGEAEVAQLSKTFNMMVVRIRALMEQIVLEQEAKRISELNALQAQINPHFLYNTLDSIVWMAENGKSDDVVTMVTSLARLFRISISKGRNVITVREEVEHARNYLVIQKIRYKNKFEFKIDVQEEALNCRTLKLLIQPIIENSIYHGIEYMVDQGFIGVSVRIEDGKLLYAIKDNGLGMSKQVLDSLLSKDQKNDRGSGVGVKNVHERIQLYYGSEYGLQVESEEEVGTTVRIWQPLKKDENTGDVSNEEKQKAV